MKIKFLATGMAPEKYEFDREKVIINDEVFDLSIINEGDEFIGIECEIQAIRDVKRMDGELYVTLCQKAPKGHWRGKDKHIDANEYDPNTLYIEEVTNE